MRTNSRQRYQDAPYASMRNKETYGYRTLDGKTMPSERINIMGRRFATWFSGGKHPRTSVHRISTYGEGSEPKNT